MQVAHKKKAIQVEAEDPVDYGKRDKPFTGMARSVECYRNNGFRNFRIVTMWIVDGVVKKMQHSDPFANFEAIARLEDWNHHSSMNLNSRWQEGAAWEK